MERKRKNVGKVNIKYKNRNLEILMGVYLGIERMMYELFCLLFFDRYFILNYNEM